MANDYIEMLKERDKAKAVRKYEFKTIEADPMDMCPNCEEYIISSAFTFCPWCGQRLDTENYALV